MKLFACFILPASVLLLLTGCQKEEKSDRDYPQIRTDAVNHINAEGARFNGVIISGSTESITEYGFVWGGSSSLTLQYSEKIVVSEVPAGENFSCDVTFALESMKEYYARAYVKAGDLTIYGDPVKFMSLGSLAPEITDFEPKSATWGDTVTIYGENFSFQRSNMMVFIGEKYATVITSNNEVIKVTVPDLQNTYSKVSVEIFGNRSTAADDFQLITPGHISSINKVDITWGDTLEITGVFPFSSHVIKILIGNTVASLIETTDIKIKAVVPNSIAYSDSIMVSLSIDNHKLEAPNKNHMPKPFIGSFSPVNFGWRDTILVYGLFNPIPGSNKIMFSNIQASLLEVKRDRIRCIVPTTPGHSCAVTGQVGAVSIVYPDNISLNGPVISEITPHTTTSNQYITIKGKYFKESITLAKINDIGSYVTDVYPTSLMVYVSNVHANGPASLEISVHDKKTQVSNVLVIINPQITGFTPTEGTYGDIITVNGVGFDPNDLVVRIGGSAPQIIEATPTIIRFEVPDFMTAEYTNISISTRGTTVYSQDNFHLWPPEIISISPLSGKTGENVTLTGSYFSPILQYNHVYFQSNSTGRTYHANIISGNGISIVIEVPSLPRDEYVIKMEALNVTCTSPSFFNCESPWRITDVLMKSEQNYSISMGVHRPDQSYTSYYDEVYTFGGFNSEVYYQSINLTDLSTNSYTDFPVSGQEVGGFVFWLNNYFYYVVANKQKDRENAFYYFSPTFGGWYHALGYDFPGEGRVHATSFSINGTLGYVLGGENIDGNLADFWLFNWELSTWTRLPDYPGGTTSGATAIVIGNSAYIIDGNEFWLFNSLFNTWQAKSDFPGSPRKLGTGFTINGKVYFGTGSGIIDYHNSNTYFNDFWEYNPSTDSWRSLTDLPAYARTSSFGYGINAKGYIGGGCTLNYTGFRDIFEYDPSYE